MNDFFRGLGRVCLGTFAGAGLGAASFFAIEAVLPKQADAAPVHTVAKPLKREPMKPRALTYTEMMNGGRQQIDEAEHAREQEL